MQEPHREGPANLLPVRKLGVPKNFGCRGDIGLCREICGLGIRVSGCPKLVRGTIGGAHNKDYSILGSTLGSPYLGKLPIQFGHCIG